VLPISAFWSSISADADRPCDCPPALCDCRGSAIRMAISLTSRFVLILFAERSHYRKEKRHSLAKMEIVPASNLMGQQGLEPNRQVNNLTEKQQNLQMAENDMVDRESPW
jgi:hypothetical protein